MPKLLLKFKAAVIKEIPFHKPSLTVGRKPDNDVVIDNPAVSGHHCRLSLQGGTYFVEDLDSTNGTYVNEKRVKKSGLHHQDVIGVVKHSLVFIETEATEAPAPRSQPAAAQETMLMSPEQQAAALAGASAAAAKPGSLAVGWLRILKGAVDKTEYELTGLSTYIGRSDRVQIPIQGKGFFSSTPEVAASIHRKADNYILVAVEDGYPRLNGKAVSGSAALQPGDIIDCGGTTLQFDLRQPAQP